MAYQLEKGENFTEGLKRIGEEEQKEVIEALTKDDPHKGVHLARKHLKKLRALFRLLRDKVGRSRYQDGNVFYRDIGRQLSSFRDITSQIEITEKLKNQYGNLTDRGGFDSMLQLLEEERRHVMESEDEDFFDENIRLISQDKGRFKSLSSSQNDKQKMVKSLSRVYKRGYKRYLQALKKAEAEPMHEWRKRVKYLWHQFQLIQIAWPDLMNAYLETLKNLADALGDYHDLAIIEEKTKKLAPELSTAFLRQLYQITAKEKHRLHQEALSLGKLIYAEKPRAFSERMSAVLDGIPFE